MTTHDLEEDFSAQLSRGDSRWRCTCGKWSTPIWHTPHAVREHAGHVREVEGELNDELRELERTDPDVADAAARLDALPDYFARTRRWQDARRQVRGRAEGER